MEFRHLKQSVGKQFAMMAKHELFRTKAGKDFMWQNYLAAFPSGTDPTFRKRSQHDCACCRHFIRAVGDVVAVIDGKLVSIWDGTCEDPTYDVVSKKMSEVVKAFPIEDVFLHIEATAGTDKTFEDATAGVKAWDHFFVQIPNGQRGSTKNFVCKGADIGGRLGETRARHDVLLRSLKEITVESVDTVLELIDQASLYRGEEKKPLLQAFSKMQETFSKLRTDEAKDNFAWSEVNGPNKFICGIRNDVIGTLLVDLSEGVPMESAVASFENKMSGTNYKRPTALVTKAMIEKAKKKVEELGLTSALERRYATLADLTTDDIIFANRDAKKVMGSVFDELTATAPTNPKTFDKVEEVPVEKFIADILPKATSLEIMVENRLTPNLVSLVAPLDQTARPLFKWPNPFSWSYTGDVTDSIKERVKQAGGNVTGDVCCRLAWPNGDDLDFHMEEPGGAHIYYASQYRADRGGFGAKSPCGGQLDVDMVSGGTPQKPSVENIFYERLSTMKDGKYRLYVHGFTRRATNDLGFDVEIDLLGTVYRFSSPKSPGQGQNIEVATIEKKGNDIKVVESLPSTQATKTTWGLNTQAFHKVNVLCLSPNYWAGNSIGNKHYFFMLDGCRNDGKARGFYNEFLRGDLEQDRKVFEMVGSKMKTDESNEQLSGLGFSSTARNSVLCKVKGAFTRTIKITF